MAVMSPGSNFKKSRFVNPPVDDIKDSSGGAGTGAFKRAKSMKNDMRVEKPSAGDNSQFRPMGKRLGIFSK